MKFKKVAGIIIFVLCLSLVTASQAWSDVEINESNFPDENFRNYISENFDTDSDGILSETEINDVWKIEVSDIGINSLEGVEFFTDLTNLSCYNNNLRDLDVSSNKRLIAMGCDRNSLESLNLSENTELTFLSVNENDLTSLDVSNNTNLNVLAFDLNYVTQIELGDKPDLNELSCVSNDLTALDVSNCPALISLDVNTNKLTSLDVSNNTALRSLGCDSNYIESLDLSNHMELIYLSCNGNNLLSLNLSNTPNLKFLACNSNLLTELDVSSCTELTELHCHENNLTSLDVSNNTALENLGCNDNRIQQLDVSSNTALTGLWCNSNNLNVLDLSQNTALNYLHCAINSLTVLDLSQNTELIEILCQANDLNTLNISGLTNLNFLDCQGNSITNLDLSNNPNLEYLNSNSNQLTELDVSSCTALTELYSNSNQLTTLNLSNTELLTSLDCSWNNLSTVDLSEHTNLQVVWLGANQITAIDVSKNKNLLEFQAGGNRLSTLDLSNNTNLITIYCHTNLISELDVSKLTKLNKLVCAENLLSTLDVSKNTNLTFLDCSFNNNLDNIDLSKNTKLNLLSCNFDSLTTLDLSNNPDLTTLYANSNKFTSLDLSRNTKLQTLFLDRNQLMNLELANNSNITNLHINPQIRNISRTEGAGNYYTLNLAEYISDKISNVYNVTDFDTGETLEYNNATGTIKFTSSTSTVCYSYNPGRGLMQVHINVTSIVPKAPVILTKTLPDAYLWDDDYYTQIDYTGTDPVTFTIEGGNYPASLYLHDNGWVTGGMSVSGTFKFTVKAANSMGSDMKEITFVVKERREEAPVINSDSLPNAIINQPYAAQIETSGTYPINFTISDGNLPEGLNIISDSGLISGTPTKSGTFKFTIQAVNEAGETTKEFTLIVNEQTQAPSITTDSELPDAVINTEYNTILSASGNTPITWTLAKKSSLPKGFKLSSSGVISGSSSKTGEYKFTITASNSEGSDSRDFTLNIKDVPPEIKTDSNLPVGTVGKKFNLSLESEGTNVKWEVVSGDLPPGIKLDSKKGTLSGKIKEMGEFSFTIRASNTADSYSDKTFTMTVYEAPKISVKSLPSAAVNKEYNEKIDFTGSELTSADCKNLPAGLSIQVVNGECVISGTPEESGKYSINVTITNLSGSVTKKLSLAVFGIEKASLPEGTTGKKYKGSITVSGIKVNNDGWNISIGDLPPGLSLSKGKISGKPTQCGSFDFTVKVSADEYFVEESYTIKIYPEDPVFKTKSLPKRKIYEPYNEQVELKTDGGAIITWSAKFPDELKNFEIDSATGIISGTPTHVFKNSIPVTAANNYGHSTTQNVKIIITADKPKITTKSLKAGTQGQEYTTDSPLETFTATGSEILKWSWTGDVPDGLELTKSGDIIGTPQESGKFKVDITVQNDGGKASKKFTLVINKADLASNKDFEDFDSESESQESESLSQNNNNESESESQNESTQQEFTENNLILDSEALSIVSNDNVMIAAILPDVEVQESGIYEFTVSLDKSVPEDAKLIWYSFPNGQISNSEDDNTATFFNDDGQEIFNVPEDFCVIVSAWFEAGITYKPVIAVKLDQVQ